MDLLPTPPGVVRRARNRLLAIGAIITTSSVALLGGVITTRSLAVKTPIETSSTAASTVSVNTPTRDGDALLSAGPQTCDISQVGSDAVPATAIGQYCVVDVTITNVGRYDTVFSISAQYGVTADGRRVPASQMASVYAAVGGDQISAWVQPIGVGDAVTGPVVFDLAQGTRLRSVELHASPGSHGVIVRLS